MVKVTLNNVNNLSGNPGSAQVVINNNNDLLEAAIENTLSRDGTSPNEMNADFLVGGASAATSLSIQGEGEIGVAG